MAYLDWFMIVKNEEELLDYCLQCVVALNDKAPLGIVSIVDNGSTDGTLAIIDSYRDKLPIAVTEMPDTPKHGELRTKAVSLCRSKFVAYWDADETVSADFADTVASIIANDGGGCDTFGFRRYWTIRSRAFNNGEFEASQCRLFRNAPGVYFPQLVHTVPTYPDGHRPRHVAIPAGIIFDHTSLKSRTGQLAKGQRYQWAVGEPYINGPTWYADVTDKFIAEGRVNEFAPEIKALIKWGPE